ncbi:MAG TPA: molecular chaperone [Verrucomicrobia bacterium]|nr:molecular chaperone [Verrucomicrobiota bacterium]
MRNIIPWKRRESAVELTPRTAHPVETLHRQMNQLFDEFFRDFGSLQGSGFWSGERAESVLSPQFDVSETDDEVSITAELPGMDEKDIEVLFDDNVLTVKGEKKQEHEEKNKNYFMSERLFGQFQRVITLPAGINVDKVKAQFKKGVLSIVIPKVAQPHAERKKIEVKTE